MHTFPYIKKPKTSGRNREENIDKRKDRQLATQTSSMPYMNIKDGYISKKFTFDTQDSLEERLDRLTSMMKKLTIQDDDQIKQFKPKILE